MHPKEEILSSVFSPNTEEAKKSEIFSAGSSTFNLGLEENADKALNLVFDIHTLFVAKMAKKREN
jgi:hypothetical protein